MEQNSTRRIWSMIAGGIFIALGIFVISNPIKSLQTGVLIVGMLMLVGGVLAVIDAMSLPKVLSMRQTLLFDAIMLVLMGALFTFGNTFIASTALSFILLWWFILTSIIQIQFSFVIGKAWVKLASNAVNLFVIAMSIYTMFNPLLANSVLAFAIAYNFIFMGVSRLGIALFD